MHRGFAFAVYNSKLTMLSIMPNTHIIITTTTKLKGGFSTDKKLPYAHKTSAVLRNFSSRFFLLKKQTLKCTHALNSLYHAFDTIPITPLPRVPIHSIYPQACSKYNPPGSGLADAEQSLEDRARTSLRTVIDVIVSAYGIYKHTNTSIECLFVRLSLSRTLRTAKVIGRIFYDRNGISAVNTIRIEAREEQNRATVRRSPAFG